MLIKLKNYVFELNAFTSVPARFVSGKIFLLLNDSSHDSHFSTRQNMEPEEFLEKKSNFSLHGFSRYLTPNMALQKIILTSFFSSSSRSRAMRSSCHNFSKILSNQNKISQTCLGVNVVVLFGFIWSRGFGVREPQSGRILPCYFRQDFEIFKFSHELYFESKWIYEG